MSSTHDVIVIGGGVIGLAVARRLAIDGLRVVLMERGLCGAEASWAGAGIIAPCNPHRDDPLHDLQDRSVRQYADFCAALHEDTGIDPEYDLCGELKLARTPDTLGILRSDAKVGASLTLSDGSPAYRFLSPEQARELEPVIAADTLGGIECRQVASVRNPRLLRALRGSCVKHGALIREACEVCDLIVDASRVTGVVLQGGDRALAGRVILCAGAWSATVDQRLADVVPVHPVRGQVVLMKLPERTFRHVIGRGKQYLVPRRDGHVLLGSTEEPEAGFSKRTTAEGISSLTEMALSVVPSLADATVVASWAGLRPGTPDGQPHLGPVPGFDGLIAATGHRRAGLTLAPATADVVAAFVQEKPYDLDLSRCAPGR